MHVVVQQRVEAVVLPPAVDLEVLPCAALEPEPGLPSNAASTRVLEKVGFRLEGRARQYLKIDGQWQDHSLYALLHDDVHPQPARS